MAGVRQPRQGPAPLRTARGATTTREPRRRVARVVRATRLRDRLGNTASFATRASSGMPRALSSRCSRAARRGRPGRRSDQARAGLRAARRDRRVLGERARVRGRPRRRPHAVRLPARRRAAARARELVQLRLQRRRRPGPGRRAARRAFRRAHPLPVVRPVPVRDGAVLHAAQPALGPLRRARGAGVAGRRAAGASSPTRTAASCACAAGARRCSTPGPGVEPGSLAVAGRRLYWTRDGAAVQ